MLNKLKMTAMVVPIVGFGLCANANTITLDTGIADYNVVGQLGETTYAEMEVGAFPIPPWVAPDGGGQWISPTVSDGEQFTSGGPTFDTAAGYSTYTLTVDELDPSGGIISGQFSSDNPGELLVNSTFITANAGWFTQADDRSYTAWTPFSVTLTPGINTIEFEVYNIPLDGQTDGSDVQNSGNPTGLIVDGTASLPDGGMTVMLLGGALVGLGALRRKLFV